MAHVQILFMQCLLSPRVTSSKAGSCSPQVISPLHRSRDPRDSFIVKRARGAARVAIVNRQPGRNPHIHLSFSQNIFIQIMSKYSCKYLYVLYLLILFIAVLESYL